MTHKNTNGCNFNMLYYCGFTEHSKGTIYLALILSYVFWKNNEKKTFNLSHLLVLELKQNFLTFY